MKLNTYEVIRLGGHDRLYSVEALLTGGSTARAVYQLRDWDHDTHVVVKFLDDGSARALNGPDCSVFSLLNAARKIARLPLHPNVLATRDTGVYLRVDSVARSVRTAPYILMEWAENGAFDPARCNFLGWLRALHAAASGLLFLHQHQCAHGNIKWTNILVTKGGEVKLSDFGLGEAMMKLEGPLPSPSIQALEHPDTPNALPNPKTDIYQLGKLFQDAATGKGWDLSKVNDILTEMTRPNADQRPSAQEVVERLRAALHAIDNPKISSEVTDRACLDGIRDAVVRRIEDCVTDYIAGGSQPVAPSPPQEKPTWYATVLLRPAHGSIYSSRSNSRPRNCFLPVYFAQYEYERRVAHSDWRNTPDLRKKPLEIDRCCSGLPIRIASQGQDGVIPDSDMKYFELAYDSGNDHRLSYIVVRNLRAARQSNTLLKRIYAGDSTVGWKLHDQKGTPVPMTREIETEIIVPIYSPSHQDKAAAGGTADWILGVINVEYTEEFREERCHEIAKTLAGHAQKFPFSSYTSDVLYHVTRQFWERDHPMSTN